ncbi:MAG TPA: AAA family ATPase [Alphaproteobacteria bacterium]|nr:AAA family ATPase [Alphaproteobacteria bacterium]
MTTVLAESFTASLARLSNDEQKQAKLTAFDLQTNPHQPSLRFHRIDRCRDPNFWSVRVNDDLRIIVHKTGSSLMLVHVARHDDAYRWAERRRIEAHPTTGVMQIVEVRELVEERPMPGPVRALTVPQAGGREDVPAPFAELNDEQLLSIGVPLDWLADVRAVTDEDFFELSPHLPAEAIEALLEYAEKRVLPASSLHPADPLRHPDAQRRFRVLDGIDELRAALDAPFEKWAIFLHPAQRALVERRYGGPARVVGSAGTGKTVVALHRVRHLLHSDPAARVLVTTFSDPLSRMLSRKLRILVGEKSDLLERVRPGSFHQIAEELYERVTGERPHLVKAQYVLTQLRRAADELGVSEVTTQFLWSEWENVVDAWQIATAEAYAQVPRLGRKSRLGARQRDRLWPVFAAVRDDIASRHMMTQPGLFAAVTALYTEREEKPFTHIVVDESQDLGVPELRFFASIAPLGDDTLFFVGDLGQRIFRQPFSWKALGVDVRGRSATLKVNYRTSHQIRRAADRLLPASVRDADGLEDDRQGTISVFEGPEPELIVSDDTDAERDRIADRLRAALADGVHPSEIGVFVRSTSELPRAHAAVRKAGLVAAGLSDDTLEDRVLVGTMHLAKGLEFRLVIVMACDEGVLPQPNRIDRVADDFELEEVLRTERQLLYVAATRARDRLIVSAVRPASEFINELFRSP